MKWLVSDSHNYIDRVHGLVCGGFEQKGVELWYFTSYFLESVCNETMESEKVVSGSYLSVSNCPIRLILFLFWLLIVID